MDELAPQSVVEKFITLEVPLFPENEKIGFIKKHILEHPEKYRKVNYVYFEDDKKRLTGILSLHTLLELPDDTQTAEHISRTIKHCYPHTTLERATSIALHNNIIDLPVLDHDGTLRGVLTSDTILKFASAFFSNKSYSYSGIIHKRSIYDLVVNGSILTVAWSRLPWLVIGAFGGAISASFVGYFEGTLERNITLALFIPAIVYMSDAVGTQTETLYIRTLALREDLNTFKYILRDFFEAALLGIIVGMIYGAITFLWKKEFASAVIIGLAMFLNISMASPIAISIPTIFRKLKMDPAIGSGPLATIIQDLTSLVVYFAIAATVTGILINTI